MKGMLYLLGRAEPAAILDDVKVLAFNDNHTVAPVRIYYSTRNLNMGKAMLELVRDDRLQIKLDDGRSGNVLLQHQSMDADGKSVGLLCVLGRLSDPVDPSVLPAETVLIADPTSL